MRKLQAAPMGSAKTRTRSARGARAWGALLLFLFSAAAHAQYPARPLKLIVPFPPGGSTDILARALAQKLSEGLAQPVVIDNRPGAGGSIGSEAAAKAAPDGTTIMMGHLGTLAVNAAIYKKLPYDTFRDFIPISLTASNTLGGVANPAAGIKSINDLVTQAKARPGEINYGSFGIGNLTHMMGELLQSAAGIKLTHVPYKGQTPAITDVLAGQIPLAFTTLGGVADMVQSGKLRLLATFGRERDDAFSDAPTVVESGYPEVVVEGWSGLLAPAGVPPQIISRVHSAVVRILAMPEVKETIARQGSKAVSSASPEEFARYIKAEAEKFHAIIKSAGLEGTQ